MWGKEKGKRDWQGRNKEEIKKQNILKLRKSNIDKTGPKKNKKKAEWIRKRK